MGWGGGLIPAAIQGTDQQDWPLDLRCSGWACLGLGRCPQEASVYPMAVPTRWWGKGGLCLAWAWIRKWGSPLGPETEQGPGEHPMSCHRGEGQYGLCRACPGLQGRGGMREGLLWTKIDRDISPLFFPSLPSLLLLLPFSLSLPHHSSEGKRSSLGWVCAVGISVT